MDLLVLTGEWKQRHNNYYRLNADGTISFVFKLSNECKQPETWAYILKIDNGYAVLPSGERLKIK